MPRVSGSVSVSGNAVLISGQLVAVSGIVSVNSLPVISVSGNAILISGQTVAIAGGINVSGSPVRVSGETIYLVSGNNVVQISGQTVTVANAVSTGVSGQSIYLVNDSINNVVKISGQLVAISGSVAINNVPNVIISGGALSGLPVTGSFTASISGQLVAVSGIVNIGNTLTIGTLPVISVSGNAVKVSGETVSVSGIVAVNSLPVISVSGSLVSVSGSIAINSLPVISVSGNAVRTSGQTAYIVNDGVNNVVQISGQTIVGSFTASVSGQPVRTSGQVSYFVNDGVNNVVSISGQTVVASVTTNISGQSVRLPNDGVNNVVWISGQIINLAPNTIVDLAVNTAVEVEPGGTPITVRVQDGVGQGIDVITGVASDTVITPSLNTLLTVAQNLGYDAVQDRYARLRVTASGDGFRLIVSISGQPITGSFSANSNISGNTVYTINDGVNNVVQISGQTVVASVSMGPTPTSGDAARVSGQVFYTVDDSINNKVKISGQLVAVSGIVNIGNSPVVLVSGQTVSVSGVVSTNVSGATVSVSGIIRLAIPTAIRTRAELACTALSGGTQLLSGDVRKATVLNAGSAGTIMFIGSTTDPPYSGGGFRLVAGNGLTIETTNFDRIRAFAATSGIMISYIGEQY